MYCNQDEIKDSDCIVVKIKLKTMYCSEDKTKENILQPRLNFKKRIAINMKSIILIAIHSEIMYLHFCRYIFIRVC